MRHTIPPANWPTKLIDAIHEAVSGDVVEVHTAAMQEMAQRALQRMYPDKDITFEIVPPPDPFTD